MPETFLLADALAQANEVIAAREDWAGDRVVGLRLRMGALRALVLAGERLQRMLLYPSEVCAYSTDKSPHDPVEYSNADDEPLCGACHADAEAYWLTLPICPACHGIPGDTECERCEGHGRVAPHTTEGRNDER